uniref:Reverse transcriptase domain-containing protein n=1 Tax=Sinocyclocheilus anshuiensis TaxID=1608454 RepID=A0A671QCI0_9TELE
MSWNVHGLNSPIKRTKYLEFLKRNNISIALIQETHLKISDILRFQSRCYTCVVHSSASNKSKGVAILFDRKLGVTIDKCEKDSEGYIFLYVAVAVHNVKICFASIYCPNIPDPNFFNLKLFAKLLVKRLELSVIKLINFDQSGFLKGRLASDNVRRFLHIIHASERDALPAAVFTLDAQKAFDRVILEYLWIVLENFGLGKIFISMVKTLYTNPLAVV